jgi:hypothetical protein
MGERVIQTAFLSRFQGEGLLADTVAGAITGKLATHPMLVFRERQAVFAMNLPVPFGLGIYPATHP